MALNSGVTDKYKLFIVVESVEDAYKIASKVKSIQEINLGGIKSREGSRNISKTINLTEEEEKMLRKLTEKGIEIEIRQLPADSKIIYK
nr:PTS sugar transporter subunit IIB [Fusobacterium varium]